MYFYLKFGPTEFTTSRSCVTTWKWLDMVWSLHSQSTSLLLSKAVYFSIYMSLAIMTKATPLPAVRTIRLSSFLRLCRAFLSSLVMLGNMGLTVNIVRTSVTLAYYSVESIFSKEKFSSNDNRLRSRGRWDCKFGPDWRRHLVCWRGCRPIFIQFVIIWFTGGCSSFWSNTIGQFFHLVSFHSFEDF